MKLLALALFLLLPGLALNAQIFGSHLSIDAHEVSGGTSGYDIWATSWGSYDRVTNGSKTLEIAAHNMGNTPALARVTIYFVSNGEEIGRATKDFQFKGPGEIKTRISAPPTTMRTVNLPSINYQSSTGVAPVTNWFIIGRSDGKIFGFKASNNATLTELDKKIRSGEIK